MPRLKLLLTINPTDTASSTKPIDEWKLGQTLIKFLKTYFSVPITVPEEDVRVKRSKDLKKKRKREDPVARGTLFIRDLGFVKKPSEDAATVMGSKFKGWRKLIADKMDGTELNLEGSKYKLSASIPNNDDFDAMNKEWEEMHAFRDKGAW